MDDTTIPASGRVEAIHELSVAPKAKARRFLLTVAQNNTPLHEAFWQNLMALKRYYKAELLVSRCTYNKRAWAAKAKPDSKKLSDYEDLWYDERLCPYFADERAVIADGLHWCGDLNILPTAVDPLSGLLTLTGAASCIFPHTKIALRCVPSGRHQAAKFCYTTGSVTQRNYIAQKAGQKADFHHCYGALLVEVDDDGLWFARQINATNDGDICDLNVRVRNGKVSRGLTVEGINWGDGHLSFRDKVQYRLAFGKGGILDTLRPKYQFFNDLSDGRSHSPHNKKHGDWHAMFRNWKDGYSNVENEIKEVAEFLKNDATRPWVKTIIVDSNHHRFLDRWLLLHDYRNDPENAIYFLKLQLAAYQHYEKNTTEDFSAFKYALEGAFKDIGTTARSIGVTILDQDESFIIAGGIECGMHGDKGPNGSRGSPKGLSSMGTKANTGHTHTAQIVDGIYTAGVTADLDQRYNRGPSSWSHSHIITYSNGKRAIITSRHEKWKA